MPRNNDNIVNLTIERIPCLCRDRVISDVYELGCVFHEQASILQLYVSLVLKQLGLCKLPANDSLRPLLIPPLLYFSILVVFCLSLLFDITKRVLQTHP